MSRMLLCSRVCLVARCKVDPYMYTFLLVFKSCVGLRSIYMLCFCFACFCLFLWIVLAAGSAVWRVVVCNWYSIIFSRLAYLHVDHLCGLVVRVPGYRSRGPGSIPGATRFCEKYWVWNGVHSASWVQLKSYLKKKCRKPRIRPEGSVTLIT
jgi:hypothetical protein